MGIVDCHTHVMDLSHFDESFAADLKRAWGSTRGRASRRTTTGR